MSLEEALALRGKNPDEYIERAMQSMAVHVEAMLALQKKGAVTFDYGNNIRAQAQKGWSQKRVRYSRICSRIHSPAILRRTRSVSLGRIERRCRRYCAHRQTRARIISEKPNARSLDEARA